MARLIWSHKRNLTVEFCCWFMDTPFDVFRRTHLKTTCFHVKLLHFFKSSLCEMDTKHLQPIAARRNDNTKRMTILAGTSKQLADVCWRHKSFKPWMGVNPTTSAVQPTPIMWVHFTESLDGIKLCWSVISAWHRTDFIDLWEKSKTVDNTIRPIRERRSLCLKTHSSEGMDSCQKLAYQCVLYNGDWLSFVPVTRTTHFVQFVIGYWNVWNERNQSWFWQRWLFVTT